METCSDAAKKVFGWSEKQSKPWIGDKTWEKIKERKEAKLKMESARSERLKQRRQKYNTKNKEVRQSAREDKRNWMEERAAAAEMAAENGKTRSYTT